MAIYLFSAVTAVFISVVFDEEDKKGSV